MQRIPY